MDDLDQMKWWQKAVFYQIYPASFADGNGDGIGDFIGMIDRLDYLQDLGVDAIWLSPHYPSPGHDCGYDISDYTDVAPEYGTMEDFKHFLDSLHQRNMRLILDLVLNHTSDQHSWFKESRSSRDNPKHDWYIWQDKCEGGPPNNWESPFGGSAWEYDHLTDQYYYHFFFKSQPDLNWRNPEVKLAMFDAARFWLDLGVDGFRLDAIGTIFEHPEYPNHQVTMGHEELRQAIENARTDSERAQLDKLWEEMFKFQVEQDGMHALMQELRIVIDEYDDRLLIGEDDNLAYHGTGDDELHMVFNFPLMRISKLTPSWIRSNQRVRLASLAAVSPHSWACNTLGNHDSPRVFNRYGDGVNDDALARLSLALLLTLRGTPCLYNGEEIGMVDLYLDDISQFRDGLGVWRYNAEMKKISVNPERALYQAARFTRDKNRTPMQWSAEANAGFSPPNVHTWLPVHPYHTSGVNVADQHSDPDSLLNFYRGLLTFRKRTSALIGGEYIPLHEEEEEYLAFLRSLKNQTCLVVLNMSTNKHTLSFDLPFQDSGLLFSSNPRSKKVDTLSSLELSPFEIYIAELT
jgi:alpha-glucosidase